MKDFFTNPYRRGQYEFLPVRRRQQFGFTLCCAFLVLAFVITGLIIYKSRRNLLMVPGILMVLPMANFLVTWAALRPMKLLSAEKRAFLAPYEEAGMVMYHMIFVDEKGKRLNLGAVVCYQGGIVGLCENLKGERKTSFETDCIVRLKKKGFSQRLRIYTDWESFTERLEGLEAEVPEDQLKKVERLEETFAGFCL